MKVAARALLEIWGRGTTEEINLEALPAKQSVTAPTWRSVAECSTAPGCKRRLDKLGRWQLKGGYRGSCKTLCCVYIIILEFYAVVTSNYGLVAMSVCLSDACT